MKYKEAMVFWIGFMVQSLGSCYSGAEIKLLSLGKPCCLNSPHGNIDLFLVGVI